MDSEFIINRESILAAEKEHKERVMAYAEMLDLKADQDVVGIIEYLKSERKKQNITQQDISKVTGLATPNIARLEACKQLPSYGVLKKYADALGYDLKLEVKPKN